MGATLLAVTPILTAVGLLLILRQSALRAGAAGLAVALAGLAGLTVVLWVWAGV